MALTTPKDVLEWRLFVGLKQSDVAQMFGITEADVKQMEGPAGTRPIHEGLARLSAKKGS